MCITQKTGLLSRSALSGCLEVYFVQSIANYHLHYSFLFKNVDKALDDLALHCANLYVEQRWTAGRRAETLKEFLQGRTAVVTRWVALQFWGCFLSVCPWKAFGQSCGLEVQFHCRTKLLFLRKACLEKGNKYMTKNCSC